MLHEGPLTGSGRGCNAKKCVLAQQHTYVFFRKYVSFEFVYVGVLHEVIVLGLDAIVAAFVLVAWSPFVCLQPWQPVIYCFWFRFVLLFISENQF